MRGARRWLAPAPRNKAASSRALQIAGQEQLFVGAPSPTGETAGVRDRGDAMPRDASPLQLTTGASQSRRVRAQIDPSPRASPHGRAVRFDELSGLLMRHKPDIVHFIGHSSSSGAMVLAEADKTPNREPVLPWAEGGKSIAFMLCSRKHS
jgi:hypothetical protein